MKKLTETRQKCDQHAKKVMNDSPGQVDFVARSLSAFYPFLVQCEQMKFAHNGDKGKVIQATFSFKFLLSQHCRID